MKRICAVFFLLMFCSLDASAGESRHVADIYRQDVSYTMARIGNSKEGLFVLGVAMGIAFPLDRGIRSCVIDHQNHTVKRAADFVSNLGSFYVLFPVAFAGYSLGYLRDDSRLAGASFTSLEAGATAGLLAAAAKFAVGRERPYSTGSPFVFKPFKGGEKYRSFPSEHSMLAWSMVTPYAVYYNQPLLYLLPVSVNFARIYKNKHWFSDTVMSSGIGFSIGYFFSKRHLSDRLVVMSDGGDLLLGIRF